MDRGIYIIPTVFTVSNIFCGYYAVILALNGDFRFSAILIGIAILLDGFDGRVARITHSTSEFGMQFDSIADVISFGLAPGILVYRWGLSPFELSGWFPCFIFLICGAMRLARYNLHQDDNDLHYFQGLPIPAAAGIVAAIVFFTPPQVENRLFSGFIMALTAGLALLMVSKIPYRSFKDFDLKKQHSPIYIFVLAVAIVTIAIDPELIFLTAGVIYLLSGPVEKAYREWLAFSHRRQQKARSVS